MSYTCTRCGKTSYNPNDQRERYCGNCHEFMQHEYTCAYCTGDLSGDRPHWATYRGFLNHMKSKHNGLPLEPRIEGMHRDT